MKVIKYALFSLMGMLIINSAHAGNASTSLKVSLTIVDTCEVSTQGNLDFGTVVRAQPVSATRTDVSVHAAKIHRIKSPSPQTITLSLSLLQAQLLWHMSCIRMLVILKFGAGQEVKYTQVLQRE